MKTRYLPIIFLATLLWAGCKKFVDVNPPYTSVSTVDVFKNAQSATAATLGIYSTLSSYTPFNVARRTGAYTDELTNYDVNTNFSQACYRDQLTADLNSSSWTEFYTLVYQANSVIVNLQSSTGVPDSVKKQLIGEAKFSRAYFYFYLVNLFGDVPMPLGVDYKANSLLARTPKEQVYQQIKADLVSADSSLSVNFVTAASTGSGTDRIRPTKWAAEAMLARFELYMGDYTDALKFSNAVIGNSSVFSLTSDLNSVFSINSSEAIWQLQDQTNNSYVQEGDNFILQYYLNNYGENQSSGLSPQLLAAFEPGDQRRVDWVGEYDDFSGAVYYYPFKYQQAYNNAPTQNETVLRLAEQYLIRAEAKANTNDLSGAVSDLNMIRNRAGLASYAGTVDKTSLITAILNERQVELFCEWGHRFFDLKRSGTINTVMGPVAAQKGGAWAAYKQIWPVPYSDMSKDPNLTQNSGY
jgi:hypothetical protein